MAEESKEGALDFTDTPAELAEAEVETEVAAEEKATDDAEQVKQPEEPADTKPPLDKVRQQVQQELGNFKRQLLAELQSERQKAAPEKPKQDDPLDKITGDSLADESDKVLAKEVLRLRQELEEERDLSKRERAERQAELVQLRREQDRRAFRESNPDLADSYETLIEEARGELEKVEGFDTWPKAARDAYANRVWLDVVGSKAKKPAAEATKPKTQPDKDARGAQITQGAPKTAKPKTHKSLDEMIIEGFTE